jgi:hypothetical protein
MNVILIKDGRVENVILADSVERAQQFYPEHTALERTEALAQVGPGWSFDGTTWTAPEPVVIPEDRRITRLAFMNRFTDAEAVAIDLASQGATVQAAYMRRYQAKVQAAQFIDLDDPDTRNGVIALEDGGLLADGRADEILNAPVQPHEKPTGGV